MQEPNTEPYDPGSPRRESTEPFDEEDPPQKSIGPYKILDVLGQGGMGIVYLAEQKTPVRRRVAVKVIKLGMDSKSILARFELERQALAVMNHPAIAKVFDAGITERGQSYFAMEFVEGSPIDSYCDDHKLTIKDRIRLFQKVCDGVQHAHQKGVLHRDLKPANILVTRKNDEQFVKIIDFGLARATDQLMLAHSIYTERGEMIGTPEYMSPEQASGVAHDIDTRTDVYSLGTLLYKLLTGELPFTSRSLRDAGMIETQRIIREVDPPRPSTKISSCGDSAVAWADSRGLSRSALRKHLAGELDWIIMKAMAKEPERRYESTTALAKDLGRYLTFEPVEAGPPSATYRLRKMIRKYRTQVVASSLVFAALVGGVITSWQLYRRAEGQKIEALKQKGIAQAVSDFLNEDLFGSITDDQVDGKNLTVRTVLDTAAGNIEGRFDDQPSVEARLRQTIGWTYSQLGYPRVGLTHLERARDLNRDVYGDRSEHHAEAMFQLGLTLQRGGGYRRAQKLIEQAHGIIEAIFGSEDDRLSTYVLAIEMYKALDKGKTAAGLNDFTLGALAAMRGKGESVASIRELLEQRMQELSRLWHAGEEEAAFQIMKTEVEPFLKVSIMRSRIAYTVSSYSALLMEKGEYEVAVALAQVALRVGVEIIGKNNQYTPYLYTRVGLNLSAQGKYEEAEPFLKAALEAHVQVGAKEKGTLLARLRLAQNTLQRGDGESAVRLIREAFDDNRETVEAAKDILAAYMWIWGAALTDVGRFDEAETRLQQGLRAAKSVRSKMRVTAIGSSTWLERIEEALATLAKRRAAGKGETVETPKKAPAGTGRK